MYKNTNKHRKEMKVEIESIKQSQTEENLEMKNLRIWTGTLEASLTRKI